MQNMPAILSSRLGLDLSLEDRWRRIIQLG